MPSGSPKRCPRANAAAAQPLLPGITRIPFRFGQLRPRPALLPELVNIPPPRIVFGFRNAVVRHLLRRRVIAGFRTRFRLGLSVRKIRRRAWFTLSDRSSVSALIEATARFVPHGGGCLRGNATDDVTPAVSEDPFPLATHDRHVVVMNVAMVEPTK